MITDTTLLAFSTMISLMGLSLSRSHGSRLERWLDPFRQRKLMRIQRHRHHGVVANERRELDYADHPPIVEHAPIGRFRYGAPLLQLRRIVVDREHPRLGRGRPPAGADVVDHRTRHARL